MLPYQLHALDDSQIWARDGSVLSSIAILSFNIEVMELNFIRHFEATSIADGSWPTTSMLSQSHIDLDHISFHSHQR